MIDSMFKHQPNGLTKDQNKIREREVCQANMESSSDCEGFVLNLYNINIMNMSLKEICGLNKTLKMDVIEILIESMLEDREHDIISHIDTYRCIDETNKSKSSI